MGLEYNIEERQLVSLFHQYRNDINIYTEDCDKDKAFYERIFKRLLANTGYVINDIFPLGDCDTVFKASQNSQDSRGLYSIDGDIYVVFAPKLHRPNLFVLDSYCIENYVIDEEGIAHAIYDISGGIETVEIIKGKINFNHAFDGLLQPIIDLFFMMSLERKYTNIHELKEYDRFIAKGKIFDKNKVLEEIRLIKDRLVPNVLSSANYAEELHLLRELYPYNYDTFLKIVSGKDYIIPYLRRYICAKMNYHYQLPNEAWKYHFCGYCSLGRLEALKDAIIIKIKEID